MSKLRIVKVTRMQYQIIQLVRAGLGRDAIAVAVRRDPLTIYGHMEALVKKGLMIKGTMRGQRRQLTLDGVRLRVVPNPSWAKPFAPVSLRQAKMRVAAHRKWARELAVNNREYEAWHAHLRANPEIKVNYLDLTSETNPPEMLRLGAERNRIFNERAQAIALAS